MSKELAINSIEAFNMKPSLIAPAYVNTLSATIRSMYMQDGVEEDYSANRCEQIVAAYGFDNQSARKPFAYSNGVAFIPITGSLVNRFSDSWGYVTGYNFIRSQLNAALADEDVQAIVFDVNSGGGMVAGCFELANDIYNSRSIKPSVAVVDASAYSAAYALASSATKVVATPSGGVGSIGALTMHADMSKMLSDVGINITLIYAGAHKVDGNPFAELPDNVRAEMQASVDTARDSFVALVARNRGLDAQVIYDTEAAVYSASKGLELGLIDAVQPPTEAVTAFLVELSGSNSVMMETTMTTETQSGADAQTQAQAVDVNAERTAERQRVSAIINCEEAKDKATLANHLALETDMSVDSAKALLAKAAPEAKSAVATTNSPFAQAMNTSANPNVGADADGQGEQVTSMSAADRILAAQSQATGVKH